MLCLIVIHLGLHNFFFKRLWASSSGTTLMSYIEKVEALLKKHSSLGEVLESLQETKEMKYVADFMEALVGAVFLHTADIKPTYQWLGSLLKPYLSSVLTLDFIEKQPHYALDKMIRSVKIE